MLVGLERTPFITTGVVIAVMVDLARLSIYGWSYSKYNVNIDWLMVACATFFALIGAYLGKKLIRKVTIALIERMVAMLLVVIALSLMSGLI